MEDIKSGRKLLRDVIFKLVFESCLLDDNLKNIYSSYLEREDALKHSKLSFLKKYVREHLWKSGRDCKNYKWKFRKLGLQKNRKCRKGTINYFYLWITFCKRCTYEIVANEAVELAKEYGDVKTYEFVNGVIAKIVKKQD